MRGFRLIEFAARDRNHRHSGPDCSSQFSGGADVSQAPRARADIRSRATGIEAYRIDYNRYPSGADEPECIDSTITAAMAPLVVGGNGKGCLFE